MNDEVQHPAKALEGVEPFWHAVISQRAPVVDKAVRRRDVADEYAEKCGEYYPGVEVVPLVPASTLAAAQARIAELEQDAARGEPVGWQPLATAPKDGKEFIVRYPLQMNCKQLVYWNLIHGFWMSKGVAQMGLGNQQAEWHPLPADEPLPKETP